jgi:hypothetical protein
VAKTRGEEMLTEMTEIEDAFADGSTIADGKSKRAGVDIA